MHVVFREAQGLEETDVPMDLGQSPADLVVLSFSAVSYTHLRAHET